MDESFRKKLVEDIERSGFGSEMRAIQIFSEAGWASPGPSAYLDRDANITREIDVVANQSRRGRVSEEHPAVDLYYSVVAEVKKSSSPWIIVRSRQRAASLTDAWQNLIYSSGLREKSAISRVMSRSSLSETLGWQGQGIHESFKKPDISSRWYSAFVSACKAAEHTVEANSPEESDDTDAGRAIYFFIAKPIVILDGQLLAAKLKEGEIVIDEIEFANVQFSFQTLQYTHARYSVDVVQLSSLQRYLSLSCDRVDEIFGALTELPIPPT